MEKHAFLIGGIIMMTAGLALFFVDQPKPQSINLLTKYKTSELFTHVVTIPDEQPIEYPNPWADYPNECDGLRVEFNRNGIRYRRVRWHKPLTHQHQKHYRDVMRKVTKEMGAEPKIFDLWMLRESSWNPHAIHVLNPDLESNQTAKRRHEWSLERDEELTYIIEHTLPRGKTAKSHYRSKAERARRRIYKNNVWWDYNFEIVSNNSKADIQSVEYIDAWNLGYGPYGFNSVLFTDEWDAESPPWIMCGDDGIIAHITAVWSARKAQKECQSLGYAGTYEDINRRLSTGHCHPREGKSKFVQRAKSVRLRYKEVARLGDKFPAKTTDRVEILHHMRNVVEK